MSVNIKLKESRILLENRGSVMGVIRKTTMDMFIKKQLACYSGNENGMNQAQI